jgi:hypothetical protein
MHIYTVPSGLHTIRFCQPAILGRSYNKSRRTCLGIQGCLRIYLQNLPATQESGEKDTVLPWEVTSQHTPILVHFMLVISSRVVSGRHLSDGVGG